MVSPKFIMRLVLVFIVYYSGKVLYEDYAADKIISEGRVRAKIIAKMIDENGFSSEKQVTAHLTDCVEESFGADLPLYLNWNFSQIILLAAGWDGDKRTYNIKKNEFENEYRAKLDALGKEVVDKAEDQALLIMDEFGGNPFPLIHCVADKLGVE